MTDKVASATASTATKKPWKKPAVRQILPGAAEFGSGNKGDGAGGGAIHRGS